MSNYVAFYFGHNVDSTNYAIDFSEGGPELQASIVIGDYTITGLITALVTALNQAGALTYSADFDRASRRVTISASGTFQLLISSGSREGVHAFELLGFTGVVDLTGASSYTSADPSGGEYVSQFYPQDYTPSSNNRQFIDPSVNESASGEVEVIRFGSRRFIEMNLRYITDFEQPALGPLVNNPNGVSDAIAFLEYATTKAKFEFMEDASQRNAFESVFLESTPQDESGTAFMLKELYAEGLPGYYETGMLKLRKVG